MAFIRRGFAESAIQHQLIRIKWVAGDICSINPTAILGCGARLQQFSRLCDAYAMRLLQSGVQKKITFLLKILCLRIRPTGDLWQLDPKTRNVQSTWGDPKHMGGVRRPPGVPTVRPSRRGQWSAARAQVSNFNSNLLPFPNHYTIGPNIRYMYLTVDRRTTLSG